MTFIIRPEQHNKTTRDRLREFDDRFMSALALGPINDWSSEVSVVIETEAPQVTFPIPINAVGYQEFKGEIKYSSLEGREANLRPRLWQDGVAENADKVEQAGWLGWETVPAQFAREALAMPNKLVADVLTSGGGDGPLLDLYADPDTGSPSAVRLFSENHLANVLDPTRGGFSNKIEIDDLSTESVSKLFEHFMLVPAPNGEPLGLMLSHVLVPPKRYQQFKQFFERDTLLLAQRNVAGTEIVAVGNEQNLFKGAVQVLYSTELSDDDTVYALALGRSELRPFVLMRGTAPEVNILDRSSYLFQAQRKIGVNTFFKLSAGAVLPHAIAKVTIND